MYGIEKIEQINQYHEKWYRISVSMISIVQNIVKLDTWDKVHLDQMQSSVSPKQGQH